jgi:hypothetical protein
MGQRDVDFHGRPPCLAEWDNSTTTKSLNIKVADGAPFEWEQQINWLVDGGGYRFKKGALHW